MLRGESMRDICASLPADMLRRPNEPCSSCGVGAGEGAGGVAGAAHAPREHVRSHIPANSHVSQKVFRQM